MVDFSVEGLISVKETLSESLEDIQRGLNEASGAAEGTSVSMDSLASNSQELMAVLAETNVGLRAVEEGFDEVGDEAIEAVGKLQAFQAESASIAAQAPMIRQSLNQMDFDAALDVDAFKREIKDQFDLSGPEFGQIRGAMSGADEDRFEDFARRVGQRRDMDFDEVVEGIHEASMALPNYNALMESAEQQTESTEDETEKLNRSFWEMFRDATQAGTALGFVSVMLGRTEAQADDAEDDIDDLARSLNRLTPALKTVSANIGPFNVGLTNLVATIPVLIATMTPLLSVIGGLVIALGSLVGAFGSLFAVGAVEFVRELEERFASIEDTMGAMEAIGQGLMQALERAFQPIFDVQFLGMDSIEFFVRILQNTFTWLNMFAQAMANILEMEEMEQFFLRVEAALLGAQNAGDGAVDMMDGLRAITEELVPVLTDVTVWLVDNIPRFMIFAAEISRELVPALAQFLNIFIDLAATLGQLGAGSLDIILGGASALLLLIDQLAEAALFLDRALSPLSDAFIVLGIISVAYIGTVLRLASAIKLLGETAFETAELMSSLKTAMLTTDTVTAGLITRFTIATAGIAAIILALVMLEKRFGAVTGTIEFFNDVLPLEETVKLGQAIAGATVAVTDFLGITEELSTALGVLGDVIVLLTSLALIVIGLKLVWSAVAGTVLASALGTLTGALWTAITAIYGYATALWSAKLATAGFVLAIVAIIVIVSKLDDIFGNVVAGIVAGIIAITAAIYSAGWPIVLAAAGLAVLKLGETFGYLKTAAVAAITAISFALWSNPIGIAVGLIGLAILAVIKYWEEFKGLILADGPDIEDQVERIAEKFGLAANHAETLADFIGFLTDNTLGEVLFKGSVGGLQNVARGIDNTMAFGYQGDTGQVNMSGGSRTNQSSNVTTQINVSGDESKRDAYTIGRIATDKQSEELTKSNGSL